MHLRRLEPDGPLFELRGDVALGVDLDEEDALADVRREQRGRGGDGALADAALPREEQQASVEQIGRGPDHGALPDAEADLAISGIACDLDEGDLVGGDPDLLALLVGEPQHARGAAEGILDGLRDLVGRLGDVEDELASGVDDSDADFHCRHATGWNRLHMILSSVR